MAANRPAFLENPDLSLLLFGGKGGVGKTTCAAAAALHLARRYPHRNYLLASIDPAHSLRDCLGDSPLPGNLQYQEIDFRASLQKFKAAHQDRFREIALRGTFLDEQDVQRLLDLTTPGFDELMAFTDVAALLRKQAWSCLVVDTAPTGHTLRFLELPELMRDWLGVFDAMLAKHRYLRELYRPGSAGDATDDFLEQLDATIRCLSEALSDAGSCRFIPVMLAEPMSTNETARLVKKLKTLKVGVREIVVNRLFPAGSRCPVCRMAQRRQQQELHSAQARFADYELWGIPLRGGQIQGAEQLARLWDGIERVSPAPELPSEAIPLPPRVERSARAPSGAARLLLFAGKGGVGKTTLACASAAYLSRVESGRKVLLFSTDPAHSLADCFDVPIGAREVPLAPGLTAMEVDATAEFQKLKQRYVGEVAAFFESLVERTGTDVAFDHDVVERMLDLSPPGLDEVMALLRVIDFVAADAYDLFILDTAPTGHLIRLLEMPEVIERWLRTTLSLFAKYRSVLRLPRIVEFLIDLSRKLKVLRRLLADPQQGQLFAVSILTEMAYAETRDLLAACRNARVNVPALFLNMATPPSSCPLCSALASTEAPIREQFRTAFKEIPETIVYRCREPRGLNRLAELGQALYVN